MITWLETFNFLHFLGLAFGLGGATIMAIISAKAEKHPEVAIALRKISPSIIKLIWTGLILLIISGIMIPKYMTWPLNVQMLVIKHILVVWIVIIGCVLGYLSKKMSGAVPFGKGKPSEKFLKLKKLMKFFGKINLILWYVVTLISVFV